LHQIVAVKFFYKPKEKKMLHKILSAALIATPLALGVVVAGAQDKGATKAAPAADKKGDNVDKDKRGTSPQTDAVTRANLADQLARYGDANKDALSMIVAANILQQVGAQDTKADKKTEGTGDPKAGKGTARDITVKGILDRAKQYAGGRKDIIAMADEASKSSSRGAAAGPRRWQSQVNARTVDIYNVTFRGGEAAMVALSGDGDTDLDLVIRDESGNVVCRSESAGDDEVCRWYPRWTGPFRIEVKNLGGVYNHYRAAHN
jgi:hypothetical protein